MRRITVFRDGNMMGAMIGPDLVIGIGGFGNTVGLGDGATAFPQPMRRTMTENGWTFKRTVYGVLSRNTIACIRCRKWSRFHRVRVIQKQPCLALGYFKYAAHNPPKSRSSWAGSNSILVANIASSRPIRRRKVFVSRPRKKPKRPSWKKFCCAATRRRKKAWSECGKLNVERPLNRCSASCAGGLRANAGGWVEIGFLLVL